MKAERRHELQTNKLSLWVKNFVDDLRPYWMTIVAGIVAVVAAIVVFGLMNNRSNEQYANSWRSFFAVAYSSVTEQNTEPLDKVAEDNKGTPSAAWALQMVGDIELRRGMRSLYQDRTSAIDALETARKKYREVLDLKGINPMLSHRANFGLGQASEALSDIEIAVDAYSKIVAVAPTTALGAAAQQRLDRLRDKDVNDFYDWFAKAELSRDPHAGMSMPNQNLPLDLGNLEGRPNINLPDFPLDNGPGTDVPFGPGPGPGPVAPNPTDLIPPAGGPADPAPAPEGTPAPTPEGTPAPTPEGTPAPTPEGTPAPTPEGTPAPTPEETPAPTPEETPAPAPEGTPAPTPEETPAPAPEGTPAPTPEGTPAPTPEGTPAPTPEGTPAPTPDGTPAPEAPADGENAGSAESDS